MKRPINICSGQFGDLTLEELCKTMHEIGYNGIEIATQAHLDVRRVLTDAAYRDQIDETLNKYDMHIGAISAHLIGQCVGDNWDPRLDNFAPAHCKGNPEAIRAWAIEEMKNVAYAAKLLNVKVVTCFLGSPFRCISGWSNDSPFRNEHIGNAWRKHKDSLELPGAIKGSIKSN